jgi:hypothetical protein
MNFKGPLGYTTKPQMPPDAAFDQYSEADRRRGTCPDHTEVGESTNAYCARQKKTLWTHAAKGRLLYLPRTEMIVVPFQMHSDGGWNVVVVRGNQTYPRGGYELSISPAEIETAIILDPEGLG